MIYYAYLAIEILHTYLTVKFYVQFYDLVLVVLVCRMVLGA